MISSSSHAIPFPGACFYLLCTHSIELPNVSSSSWQIYISPRPAVPSQYCVNKAITLVLASYHISQQSLLSLSSYNHLVILISSMTSIYCNIIISASCHQLCHRSLLYWHLTTYSSNSFHVRHQCQHQHHYHIINDLIISIIMKYNQTGTRGLS